MSCNTYHEKHHFEVEITLSVFDEQQIEKYLTKIGMLGKENQELKKSITLLTKQITELLQQQDEMLSHEELQKNFAVLDPSYNIFQLFQNQTYKIYKHQPPC